jgi:nitrogen fixation NifU-like protein
MRYASPFFWCKLVGMNIYQQELMDHYRFPRNYGLLKGADFLSREHNPSCGDMITVSGRCNAQHILTAIGFEGTGCVISIATASLLYSWCLGKTSDELKSLDRAIIKTLIGIELGPTRLKCALLPLQALVQGLLSSKK